ncbi:MAG: hypothetical protein HKM93_09210 [Desulfobacteraceae bacterium]|nr:hypothetical protein [Desulfobacteraceae bacterium]
MKTNAFTLVSILLILQVLVTGNTVGAEDKTSPPPGLKAAGPTGGRTSELDRILEDHRLWVASKGVEGNRAILTDFPLNNMDLREARLSGADLSGVVAYNADLSGADLSEANLTRADLREANLTRANLYGADLQNAILSRAKLNGAILTAAKLQRAQLNQAELNDAFLIRADLEEADLTEAHLEECNLYMANLKRAALNAAILIEADLTASDLTYAQLEKADLTRAKLQKPAEYLEMETMSLTDLSHALLNDAVMVETNMSGIIARDAKFKGTDLTRANLSESTLSSANFHNAILLEARFVDAVMNDVILLDCTVDGASLVHADLTGSTFEPKTVENVLFTGVVGLSTLKFTQITPIVSLRNSAREAGLRTEERALTAALRKYRLDEATISERVFEYVFFDFFTDSGENPWKSLLILSLLFLVFSVVYMVALVKQSGDGIFKVWQPTRVRQDLGSDEPEKIEFNRMVDLKTAFYFSLISAFGIGWRELNVGNWIARMQRREYSLMGTGWVRTVAGIQSLLSVYLLALWALTYFSRPFG